MSSLSSVSPKSKPVLVGSTWAVAGVSAVVVLLVGFISGKTHGDDWSSIWIGGKIVSDGNLHLLYDYWEHDFTRWSEEVWSAYVSPYSDYRYPHPYVHVPILAGIMAPLTQLISFKSSLFVFTAFSVAALPILVASSYYIVRRTPISWRLLSVITAIVMVSQPALFGLELGQTTPLIMAAVAYGIAAAHHRPVIAGIWIGIVGIIKLSPLALIVVFFIYRRRAAVAATVTAVVGFAGSVLIMGVDVFRYWIETLRELGSASIVVDVNLSLKSQLMERSVDRYAIPGEYLYAPIAETPTRVAVASLTLMFGLLMLVGIRWIHDFKGSYEVLAVGGYSTAVVVASIYWTHYALVLVMPLVYIGVAVYRSWSSNTAKVIAVLSVVSAGTFFITSYPPLLLAASIYTIVLYIVTSWLLNPLPASEDAAEGVSKVDISKVEDVHEHTVS